MFCIQKQGLNKGPDHYSLIYGLYKLILDVCHSFFLPILSQQEMEDVGFDLPNTLDKFLGRTLSLMDRHFLMSAVVSVSQ